MLTLKWLENIIITHTVNILSMLRSGNLGQKMQITLSFSHRPLPLLIQFSVQIGQSQSFLDTNLLNCQCLPVVTHLIALFMAYLCHQRQLIKVFMFNLFGKFILGILMMFESIREQETPCVACLAALDHCCCLEDLLNLPK